MAFDLRIGTWRLASRRSIVIEKEEENLNLADDITGRNGADEAGGCTSNTDSSSGSACAPAIKSLEKVLTVRFLGSGDLKAADSMYQSLNTYLSQICSSTPQTFYRQVCDETREEIPIVRGYMRRIDIEREFYGNKSAEIHLISREETGVMDIIMDNTENLLPPVIV